MQAHFSSYARHIAMILAMPLLVNVLPAFADVCPPQHIDETARVNYVYDGDTLQLEDGRKIRLIGIDTPEVFSKRRSIDDDVKASGERARDALQQQLNRVSNRISLGYGSQRFDRYGRTLAHVYLPNGTNVQAWLISQGHAIAFTTPPNDRQSHCYQRQEAKARDKNKGIWQMPQYQLKQTSQLNVNSRGFHRLQGRVSRLVQKQFNVILFLDEKVKIRIYRYDLPNFSAFMLNNLQGKQVQIRGWLQNREIKEDQLGGSAADYTQPEKKYFVMALRHPDSITVQNSK